MFADLEIRLPCGGMNAEGCLAVLERILVELLACSSIDEPTKKRMKREGAPQHELSKCFEVTQRVWIGRRGKRRLVSAQKPTLSEWQIEQAVSGSFYVIAKIASEKRCDYCCDNFIEISIRATELF